MSRQRVLLHILFWIWVTIFFCTVYNYHGVWTTLYNAMGFLPGHIIFVYLLIYVLVPYYILKGRLVAAIPAFLLILATALFYLRFADVYILHYSGRDKLWFTSNFPRSTAALFSVGWIAVSIKLVKYWYREKDIQQILEREKLSTELQLLRSQLHPHFLFNTLNNLYSLTLERSNQAPEAILKLSALLRYILYESNTASVPVAKEIEILRYYIGLEQLRYGDRLDLSIRITGDFRDKEIAPLLLLPFMENSFKHGTSEQPDACWISLHLHVGEDRMDLKLSNSCQHLLEPNRSGGLGLQNSLKRLQLLYPGSHTLKILAEEDCYTVSLSIPLTLVGRTETVRQINPYYETQVSPG